MKALHNQLLFRQACYINGKWCEVANNQTIKVENPATGKIIGVVPNLGQQATAHAIAAAHAALPSWQALTAKERCDFLQKWATLIDANKHDLAVLMTIEQGKPLTESLSEIEYANDYIKWFAAEACRVYGDVIPANKASQRILVIRQAIGVVAAITPWNFPAAMLTRKLSPALAVGCTIVAKPASETPYSALALAVLAEEAGIPPGVLNMVTGDASAIGAEMTSNPLVRKVSFTGSTAVGRLLMQQCAPTIKKLSLELGGNAPFIVFDDADIDAAVEGAMISKFRNTGQTCVCANRIYAQEKIYEKFADKLTRAVKKLKVGNGLDEGVTQGPLINQKALEKVEQHIHDATKQGANIICGGKPDKLGGLFFEPTVIVDVNQNMLIAHEETFGPIAPLFRFTDEKEAIKMANASEFGLASYFYSKDVNRIFRVAEALECGMVGINTGLISAANVPFGGIKQSGMGREGSKYGLDAYVEMKYLCLAID